MLLLNFSDIEISQLQLAHHSSLVPSPSSPFSLVFILFEVTNLHAIVTSLCLDLPPSPPATTNFSISPNPSPVFPFLLDPFLSTLACAFCLILPSVFFSFSFSPWHLRQKASGYIIAKSFILGWPGRSVIQLILYGIDFKMMIIQITVMLCLKWS